MSSFQLLGLKACALRGIPKVIINQQSYFIEEKKKKSIHKQWCSQRGERGLAEAPKYLRECECYNAV